MKTEQEWVAFNNDMRKLLLDHKVPFAAVWLRDEDDLVLRGYSEDGEGLVLCTAFQKWMEKNMERLLEEVEVEVNALADVISSDFASQSNKE